ncbi:MAG: hypothetical protein C7B43_21045 [Sulfobacillus benefaciens]|uniref:RCK C-terminal domain-containing protein n=1 Tax=Sulfobacillus benefaciens TaxID=453960 RepID=A0A2T2WI26_9FIRM|nr:MAG: hypothetical protein C7B43_21045 [Sulfobacillus benefaciens]
MPLFFFGFWQRVSKHQILFLTGLIVLIMIVSATLFSQTQHVSWLIGLYWAVTTVTTVGYGDVTPHNTVGRWIAMGTMLTAIPLAGAAFAGWAAAIVSIQLRKVWGMTMNKIHNHLVILGYSPLLIHILPDLLSEHPQAVIVSPLSSSELPDNLPCITGDPTHPHILAKASLPMAQQIVVVGESDGAVLMTAIEAHRIAPKTPIFAITQSRQAAQTLKDLGMTHSVASQDLLGHTLAKSLATPHAADFFVALLTSPDLALEEISVQQNWVGQRLDELELALSSTILAVIRQQQVILPLRHPVIEADDTILLLRPPAPGLSPAAS